MPRVPVSAIIPVRDGASFIGEALESVFSQSWCPQEIIVIDDGSTDDTPAEVARFTGVNYTRQSPLGVAEARNHGARRATMTHLAYLDADDLWANDKTERQMRVLSANPDLDIVSGQMIQFRDCPTAERQPVSLPTRANLPGLMLMRSQAFWRVGPYSPELKVGDGIEWWSRALDLGLRIRTLDTVVLMRRLHDRNMGHSMGMHDYLHTLHRIVGRRRRS
jgi:glycosyltransferase involved in cell wall biosynthesis